ncbi:MAG: competence/damage-inducible protein A [Oligoflexus sp.]
MAEHQGPIAALLTVGTEVTSGQIVNTNATWISDQISNAQIPVQLHLAVEDEQRQILDALNFAAEQASLIFITGGLGPTRDDLTRDAISNWLGQELSFDEASWQRICERLTAYGIPIAASNRQQCYFPQKAQILTNELGTANAFFAEHQGKKIWCLPGPPREIHRIWQDHIAHQLAQLTSHDQAWQLLRWQCLGHSESSIGELVESVIQGTELISGYRPHIPYVEVKIWCPLQKRDSYAPVLETLEKTLSPWLASRDDEDLAQLLLQQLSRFPRVQIYDAGSQGVLTERLGQAYRRLTKPNAIVQWTEVWDQLEKGSSWIEEVLNHAAKEQLTLAIGSLNSQGQWPLGLTYQGRRLTKDMQLPYRGSQAGRQDRYRRFLAEKSMHEFLLDSRGFFPS